MENNIIENEIGKLVDFIIHRVENVKDCEISEPEKDIVKLYRKHFWKESRLTQCDKLLKPLDKN